MLYVRDNKLFGNIAVYVRVVGFKTPVFHMPNAFSSLTEDANGG